MEIRQLRHFLAVAESGNMRRASERIHISHPALSISIKNLEQSLDVVLFERSAKGVTLTEAGTQLVTFAQSILKSVDDARTTLLSTETQPMGLVKLGCTPGAGNVIGLPLYMRIREQYPNIQLEIDDSLTPVLRNLFAMGLLDLMIDYDLENTEDFLCEPLVEEELFLVGKRSSVKNETDVIEFSELANYPLISNTKEETSIRRTYEKYSSQRDIQLQYIPGLQSAWGELALAENGIGYLIIPSSLFFNRRGNPDLVVKRIKNPTMYRSAYLISPLDRPLSSASIAVKELLKSVVKEVHEKGQWRGNLLFS